MIVREIPPSNFVIQRAKNSLPKVVHADKLKAWGGDPLPSWLDTPTGPVDGSDADEADVPQEAANRLTANDDQQGQEDDQVVADDGQEVRAESDTEVAQRTRPVRERRRPRRFTDYKL